MAYLNLESVSDYVQDARTLLLDRIAPYRYDDISLLVALNIALLDVLMRMGQVLDEQNIPEVGRWVVMPAWAGRMIKQSELRQAYLSGDSVSMLRNGRLGMVDRFTLYISNLLPNNSTDSAQFNTGEWPIFAGHAHGLTFASQISKVETLRSELTFGQILRGLQVYGYQVVDGRALVQAQVTPAS